MIRFLLKGLIRDKSRSRLPIVVVAIGVMLTVFVHAYITGIMGDMVEKTAKFSGGHIKIMSKAYAEQANQIPNDLALVGVYEIAEKLTNNFSDMDWVVRIRFGGLIDVPDTNGETKSQGPAIGMGIDFFSEETEEIERLNLKNSLVRGNLPQYPGEVLLSEGFARKLDVNPGEEVTLIGTTMMGGMAFYNFIVAGTVKFGNSSLDRGTIIGDIEDIRKALDMQDAAGEILGFFPQGFYTEDLAKLAKEKFVRIFPPTDDEYAPTIESLRDQESMSLYIDLASSMGSIITFVFMLAMSLVLWNAGLLGGLRRYGEIGVRIAIGEEKGHIYRTMIYESIMIGVAGTVVGTIFGLFFAWLLQEYGLNIGEFTKNSTSAVMIPDVVYARITTVDFIIGFIPGVLSTLVGAMLAGIGIYKRNTAQLFKELEA